MAELTADETGKPVVNSDGEEIGGELKSRLGWGRDARSEYPLRNDAIGEITDEEIRPRD